MEEESYTDNFAGDRVYAQSVVMNIKDGIYPKNISIEELFKRGPFVDLGCGIGYLLKEIQNAYPNIATIGVDVSEEYLKKSRKESPKSILIHSLLENLPFPSDSVPILFSSRIYQLCNEGKAADPILREAYRVLEPGDKGIYLLSCEPLDHIKFYEKIRNAGFDIIDHSEIGVENIYYAALRKPLK